MKCLINFDCLLSEGLYCFLHWRFLGESFISSSDGDGWISGWSDQNLSWIQFWDVITLIKFGNKTEPPKNGISRDKHYISRLLISSTDYRFWIILMALKGNSRNPWNEILKILETKSSKSLEWNPQNPGNKILEILEIKFSFLGFHQSGENKILETVVGGLC